MLVIRVLVLGLMYAVSCQARSVDEGNAGVAPKCPKMELFGIELSNLSSVTKALEGRVAALEQALEQERQVGRQQADKITDLQDAIGQLYQLRKGPNSQLVMVKGDMTSNDLMLDEPVGGGIGGIGGGDVWSAVQIIQEQVARQEMLLLQMSANVPRTCQEIRAKDPSSKSAMYWIDPDGHGAGQPPIHVACNMETGSTLISHDSQDAAEVARCREPGCHSRPIIYDAPTGQILSLIQRSTDCRQWIQYDCFSAPLEFNGVAFSWWQDKNGAPQTYWTGAGETEQHLCQCSLDNSCVDPSLACNCDSYEPTNLTDAGYITKKEALPISSVHFGRTAARMALGRHTVGRLECWGQVQGPGMPRDCADLRADGHTLNAIYTVKKGDKVVRVYCDMTKVPGDDGFETVLASGADQDGRGTREAPSGGHSVYFYVLRYKDREEARVTFELEAVNIGDGMNISTGVFTAPVKGVYFFSFSGNSHNKKNVHLQLLVDGVYVGSAYSSPHYATLSLTSVLRLDQGAEVYLELVNGKLSDDVEVNFTHFVGMLMRADEE